MWRVKVKYILNISNEDLLLIKKMISQYENLSRKILIIQSNSNLKISNELNIVYLRYNDDFNREIKNNTLPQSLIKLIFGNNYNKPLHQTIKNLIQLEKLVFGDKFNQQIYDNSLPKTNFW
jgi:hypothetical protein